ncbi:MAG: hypothetical protein NZ699_06525 [Roseiflexus sp.]|nr:hypothetical protein [Roseiflexus sp.]MCS7288769.1 hypothetical protein [Roseiflexus sp.]MDW8147314.1 hypothetical protein [Roseiflexaceae bacterium]MDW8233898.1 hypothetical protein [Roseiflexaceae bacterium]
MGEQSRARRERRERATYLATVSNCEGTWLERPPDAEEQAKIDAAGRVLRRFRLEALQLGADQDAFNRFSLEIFRDERFKPLHFSDDLIEMILDEIGEPPVVEDENDPSFTNYLLRALGVVASSRVRRVMAEQARRFLPQYVDAGQYKEALAIEHNCYMTVMSNAATPLLVQMLVSGLARYYEEHETDEAVTS